MEACPVRRERQQVSGRHEPREEMTRLNRQTSRDSQRRESVSVAGGRPPPGVAALGDFARLT